MTSLRSLIGSGRTLVAPGATDALSAKLIEAHGFDCVYIGSYATAASRFGIPDTGLLSLEALAEQARTIAQAVKLPVFADAEGGFHEAGEIWRTVQAFERAQGVQERPASRRPAGAGELPGLPTNRVILPSTRRTHAENAAGVRAGRCLRHFRRPVSQ